MKLVNATSDFPPTPTPPREGEGLILPAAIEAAAKGADAPARRGTSAEPRQGLGGILSLLLIVSLASALPAEAKPKGCFSKAEETAEQVVRQGLRLREGARGCDGDPWNQRTQAAWDDIDKRLGSQFAAQTKTRKAAFQREFDKDAENHLSEWDARIVTHYRQMPLSPIYCRDVKKLLTEVQKKGWSALLKQAAKGSDQVKMVYKSCG
jgi:hypothetical protein